MIHRRKNSHKQIIKKKKNIADKKIQVANHIHMKIKSKQNFNHILFFMKFTKHISIQQQTILSYVEHV